MNLIFRRPGSYAAGLAFLPPDADRPPTRRPWRGSRPTRAWRSSAGGTCRTTRTAAGTRPGRSCRELVQLVVAGLARRVRAGAGPQGVLPAQAGRARDRPVPGQPVQRDDRVQGHADRAAAGAVLPRPVRPAVPSAIALVHARFSTNTFPSWPLAHPYRLIAHNGEINTIRGNRNWMRAREAQLAADVLGTDAAGRGIERLLPILDDTVSDSASFDACLELLHLGGRSLPHAVLMMIPEPWENNFAHGPGRREFYRFHASLMEPWDGPGADRVHRRHRYRRGAGPQRAAARPVLGDRRRPGRAGQRGRRAGHRPGPGGAQGQAAAGPHLPGRHRGRPDHRGRGSQGEAGGRAPVRRLAARRA